MIFQIITIEMVIVFHLLANLVLKIQIISGRVPQIRYLMIFG